MLNDTIKIVYSQWQEGYIAKRITEIINKIKSLRFYTLYLKLLNFFVKILKKININICLNGLIIIKSIFEVIKVIKNILIQLQPIK